MLSIFKKQVVKYFLSTIKQGEISSEFEKLVMETGRLQEVRALSEYFERPENLYSDLGCSAMRGAAASEPVFVTARFRSGSTYLWQLLRATGLFHCYYEPLNERMWFNSGERGSSVDITHRGVNTYWDEYEQLSDVAKYFSHDWTYRRLWMNEFDTDENLRKYIGALITQAPKRPVLQFNRVDFRLPWLRANFSKSKIIHLYRHPRDQWLSCIKFNPGTHKSEADKRALSDHFYTNAWLDNLSRSIGILDRHSGKSPYHYYYLLWRLSYLAGKASSDASVSYESLVSNPSMELERVLLEIGVEYHVKSPLGNLKPHGGSIKKWERYASEDWFKTIEEAAEMELEGFLQAW